MGLYLGIDFGTSTNYVVRWNEEKKEIEPVCIGEYGEGSEPIENVIYYGRNSNIIIGETAYKKYINDPENVVKYVKRHIVEDNWTTYIPSQKNELSAQDIATDIFMEIKKKVEKSNGSEFIDGVVISVPFAFLHNERQKIKKAAENAGLKVLNLIEEPVAAAIRYASIRNINEMTEPKKIMIFDLGGGTLDVTIFSCKYEDKKLVIEVLNTDGHKYLGGKDIDDLFINKLQEKAGYYIKDIKSSIQREREQLMFMEAAFTAKEELSDGDETNVFLNLDGGRVQLDEDIEEEEFEEMLRNNGFLSKIEEIIENAILDIDLEYEDIDEIVLVGGSSKVIAIKNLISELFGKDPVEVTDPALLVGEGAAIFCGSLIENHLNYRIIPRLSQGIGIKKNGKFQVLIEKNSRYNTASEINWYPVKKVKNTEVCIEVYQGNSENIKACSQVGTIDIDVSMFIGNEIGLQLLVDESGIVKYKLYKQTELLDVIPIEETRDGVELNG